MSTSIPLLGPALTEVAAHLSLSRSSYHLRQNTLTSIRNGARRIWPSAEVIVIGSFAQNLSLGDSDLDVTIVVASVKDVFKALQRLKDLLVKTRAIPETARPEVIKTARCPILTYTLPADTTDKHLLVDISFNNSLAIKCTDYVVRRLDGKAYLRDILLILKAWLKHKGQGTVYTGGMGGYSIALTLMGFIAYRERFAPRFFQGKSTTEIFTLYLDFWINEWCFEEDILDPESGSILKKASLGWFREAQPWLLSIQDPVNPENDVSYQSYRIRSIIESFRALQAMLRTSDLHGLRLMLGLDITRQEASCEQETSALVRGEPSKALKKKNLNLLVDYDSDDEK